jgi:hypothetical protein
MQIAEAVDFGPHIIQARALVRDIHNTLNDGHKEQAEELALKLIAEAKLLMNVIKHQ